MSIFGQCSTTFNCLEIVDHKKSFYIWIIYLPFSQLYCLNNHMYGTKSSIFRSKLLLKSHLILYHLYYISAKRINLTISKCLDIIILISFIFIYMLPMENNQNLLSYKILITLVNDLYVSFYYNFQRIEQPIGIEIKSDSVRLLCKTIGEKPDHYQVRFKTKQENSKWKSVETDSSENTITISELMADTEYIFQVRGIFGDEEGPFSPVTKEIKTEKSLATSLLGFCGDFVNNDNCPPIYLLPVKENPLARNNPARTRQLVLGNFFSLFTTFLK